MDNYAHRKIRESLLGSAGVGSFPGIIKRCTLGLYNQQAGSYAPVDELELIIFRAFPFGELVWNLSIQVNNSLISVYITIFYLRRVKHRCFIPFLFYNLVYPSIASNLVTLSNLIPWYDYVCTHTCSHFSSNPLLR